MPMLRLAQAEREQALCLVCRTPGHERAAQASGLCSECSRMRHDRGQTVEAFVNGRWALPAGVAAPLVRPLPGRRVSPVGHYRRAAVRGVSPPAGASTRADRRPSFERFIAAGPWEPSSTAGAR